MTLDAALNVLGPGLESGLLPALATTFVAGILASAVCPCTLPVGLSVAGVAGASEAQAHNSGMAVAIAFFIGIVASLTGLGLAAGELSALATEAFGRAWALVMAGLSLVGALVAFMWPRMQIERLTAWRQPGIVGAFGYGLVFSVGTSVAPLLLLLAVAAGAQAPEYALLLAFVFGVGRGLPFLLAGAAGSTLTRFTRLGVWGRAIQVVSGIALLFVAWYYADVYLALS